MLKTRAKIRDIQADYVNHKPLVIFEFKDEGLITSDEFVKVQEKELDIEIKVHKEKRNLSQNAYFWMLCTEIGNVLKKSKEEVHEEMLKRYSQREYFSCLAEIDVSKYFKYYDYSKQFKNGGKLYKSYIVYKGSSQLDVKEFSILLEGTRTEAEDLGISVLTALDAALLDFEGDGIE